MALQKSYSLPSGLIAPDAYHKIMCLNMTKDELTASVKVFATIEARDADSPSIADFVIMLPYSAQVTLAYAYDQLKLFPDYAGAIDC